MGYSAPVSRLGTLTLVGPPLGFLPYHRNDRFPRSTHEPDSGSRYLYAGRAPQAVCRFLLDLSWYPVSYQF